MDIQMSRDLCNTTLGIQIPFALLETPTVKGVQRGKGFFPLRGDSPDVSSGRQRGVTPMGSFAE